MGVARASVHVDGEAARALLLNGMERVSATGGTIGFMLEVGALAEEVCVRRRGRGWLMAVQRPLQLGTINVLSVQHANPAASVDQGKSSGIECSFVAQSLRATSHPIRRCLAASAVSSASRETGAFLTAKAYHAPYA